MDELDRLEEPETTPRPKSNAPTAPPVAHPTRAPRRRNLRLVLVVLVVVVVVFSGSVYYALVMSSQTNSRSLPPASVCLGDTAGDWPTYLAENSRNSQNCGKTDLSSANAVDLTQLWSFNMGAANPGYLEAEPAVVNGTVYIGGGNGVFYALNATTGTEVWQSPNLGTNLDCTNASVGITSSATVTGGVVYVGGGDGNFYALSQATGTVDWQFLVGTEARGYYNWASPLVLPSLGYVYLGVSSDCDNPLVDGGLDQVSLSTHQLVRFFSDLSPSQQTTCDNALGPPFSHADECGASIWSSPAYNATTNTVWATTGNGYIQYQSMPQFLPEFSDSLMEWNATTLALVSHWTIPNANQILDGDFGTTPTLVNPLNGPPMVFVTNKNGWSYAFNRTNIAQGPVWQTDISETPTVTPDAYGGGLIYIAGHGTNVGATHYPGSIRAFDPLVNKTFWALGMPGEVYGAPVYANGLVVVAGGDLLEVLNASTGTPLFSYTGSGPFLAAPAIADGVIYVGNSNGLVLAFGVASTPSGPEHPPATSGPAAHLESSNGLPTYRVTGTAAGLSAAFLIAQAVRRS